MLRRTPAMVGGDGASALHDLIAARPIVRKRPIVTDAGLARVRSCSFSIVVINQTNKRLCRSHRQRAQQAEPADIWLYSGGRFLFLVLQPEASSYQFAVFAF